MLICATCAVERDEPTPGVCPICTNERQYVPEDVESPTKASSVRGRQQVSVHALVRGRKQA
jgi:hypothetical protein